VVAIVRDQRPGLGDVARLGAEPMTEREDLDRDETVLAFRAPGNAVHANQDNTVVGTAVVGREGLVLETNSRRRGALSAEPRPAFDAVPPLELVEAVRSAKAAHYRAWVEQSLPARG
jgi:hypothetical protein